MAVEPFSSDPVALRSTVGRADASVADRVRGAAPAGDGGGARHHHLRYHGEHQASAAHPFGTGAYGRFAERVARSLGTPQFLIGQTLILIVWIALNGLVLHRGAVWDVYPFILLNLMLSFQAAYAAPLILVASNRQGQRDALRADADAKHREDVATQQHELLERLVELIDQNTDITTRVHTLAEQMTKLTEELHAHICVNGASGSR